MTLQTIIYHFLGRSYYTFATLELKSTTRFACSPGQGNWMGVVPAKPSHVPVPAVLAAGGGKPEMGTLALCPLREQPRF